MSASGQKRTVAYGSTQATTGDPPGLVAVQMERNQLAHRLRRIGELGGLDHIDVVAGWHLRALRINSASDRYLFTFGNGADRLPV